MARVPVVAWSRTMEGGDSREPAGCSRPADFMSLDGLHLKGTLELSRDPTIAAAVLVHGGGVTRGEGGFFTRIATALRDAQVSTLRFDFRAHGESQGRQEELTLAGVANDIRAADDYLCRATEV